MLGIIHFFRWYLSYKQIKHKLQRLHLINAAFSHAHGVFNSFTGKQISFTLKKISLSSDNFANHAYFKYRRRQLMMYNRMDFDRIFTRWNFSSNFNLMWTILQSFYKIFNLPTKINITWLTKRCTYSIIQNYQILQNIKRKWIKKKKKKSSGTQTSDHGITRSDRYYCVTGDLC